jgi:hypothetical protein
MRPGHGLLNLLQAAVYGVLGAYFSQRWFPGAVLLWASAAAQALTGCGLLMGKTNLLMALRLTALLSLSTVALLIGLHLQLAVHIVQTFTPIGAETAWAMLAGVAVALPWVLAYPIWQLIKCSNTGWMQGVGTVLFLLLALGPPAFTGQQGAAHTRYAPIDGAGAGEWLWSAWHGADTPPPRDASKVALIRSHLRAGRVVETASAEAESLEEALASLLPSSPPRPGDALVLEVLVAEGGLHQPILAPDFIALNPGIQGFRLSSGLQSSRKGLDNKRIKQALFAQQLRLPVVPAAEGLLGWTRNEGWLIDEAGAKRLRRGWTAPEHMGIAGLERAAVEAARHLRYHMKRDGKFAYVVAGPSGTPGGGYNFPRHAGGTWFMARIAQRTGDVQIQRGAQAAAAFLERNTVRMADGRAYVIDPKRKDGKAWVGTTALALLAFIDGELYPDLQKAYVALLASSVDEDGKVLGDLDRETERFPLQPAVTYAQGQVLLALATADEAKIPGASEALNRAVAYVEGPYWPQPAARFGLLDEHWMCIAADKLDQSGHPEAGRAICEAYLANQMDLDADSPLAMPAGPAGGIAEAWMGAALMDARRGVFGRHFEQALEHGKLLLAQRYRPADAAFLPRPEALLGGFRDNAWNLDVRVDAVQHIGFALLGLAELLSLQPSATADSI